MNRYIARFANRVDAFDFRYNFQFLFHRFYCMTHCAHSLPDEPDRSKWETTDLSYILCVVMKNAYHVGRLQRKVQQMLHLSGIRKQKKFLIRNSVSIHAPARARLSTVFYELLVFCGRLGVSDQLFQSKPGLQGFHRRQF